MRDESSYMGSRGAARRAETEGRTVGGGAGSLCVLGTEFPLRTMRVLETEGWGHTV